MTKNAVKPGPDQRSSGRAKRRQMIGIGNVSADAPIAATLRDIPRVIVVLILVAAGSGRITNPATNRKRQAQPKGKHDQGC